MALEHSPRVLAYLRRRVDPPEEAADLLQSVLSITWRKLEEVPKAHEAALCWMLVVARGELNNLRRAQARRYKVTEAIADALRVPTP
ncbi:MAG: sigma-70 family RNA polymerase sigma factor, partial [Propionibacterium sp.]|nr:sigma-70 family RNA polymerase sigma factor [Propionibacterium sp.]